ncbi:MAG: bacillithiol biosynthesis deacetylase BshB1 [Cytophagales bacterium]
MSAILDFLAFGAHPDDVELGCAASLYKQQTLGYQTGIIDLTLGEMGTRGTVEIRLQEAQNAKEILKASVRENLKLPDGFLNPNDIEQKHKIITALRKHRPTVVLCNAPTDRHPDHGNGHQLVVESCFLAGLAKIETVDEDGNQQLPWRPKSILSYIQDRFIMPDVILDVSEIYNIKEKSILAHKSQFFDPESKETQTYISSPKFLDYVKARDTEFGRMIACEYGEGFISIKKPALKDLMNIVPELY